MRFIKLSKLIICFVLLLVALSSMCFAAEIKITADPQLPVALVENVQKAASATTEFYERKYGLRLDKPIEIVLAADVEGYKKAMIDVLKFSPEYAEKFAKHNKGVSSWNIASYRLSGKSTMWDIYMHIPHEMTHTYQRQLASTNAPGKMTWLWEGMANVMSAQIVAEQGIRSEADTRKGWLSFARKQAIRPGLKILFNQDEWFRAMDMYSIDNVYNLATLAVDYLAQKKGHSALIEYVRLAKTSPDGPTAFKQAFGLALDDFAAEFKGHLEEQLNQQ